MTVKCFPEIFFFTVAVLAVSPLFGAGNYYEECGWENCSCKKNLFSLRAKFEESRFTKPPGNGRQYARSRVVDVTHQKIEFTPDFAAQSISGSTVISFSPIRQALESVEFDAYDLEVAEVTANHPIASWDNDDRRIAIHFKNPVPEGTPVEVTVRYSAHPRDGLFFRTEAMGYPKGDDHLWTQGEPEKHRHWYPCYDFPNERFTTEVICHVPETMTVLSNGSRVSDTVKEGLRTVHWSQEQEHVNYLVSVVAGHFKSLEDKSGEVPLAFLTTPSNFNEAANSFRDTAKILVFLENEIGVKYPWAKYYNVCVADFVAGGMENTSITTLTDDTLFSADSGTLRSSHSLDAHEVTHQWFGDLLTCKDWSELWLNEGFATYYTHLYEEHKNGRDAMLYGLYRDLRNITENRDEKPIVWRGFVNPWEQFDYRAYPKGSWVLHMLRSQLGVPLYRKAVLTYLERHRNTSVETADLRKAFEDVSGLVLDEFFDQWVYHGGTPQLEVKYQWDGKTKKAVFAIRQTQKISDKVLLFDFYLPLLMIDEEGQEHRKTVRIQSAEEKFSFSLPERPVLVRVDPDLTVLARIDFNPPAELLRKQLENQQDVIGRILAVAAIGKNRDEKSMELLKQTLNHDPFYGVRIEAAKTLAAQRSPEAHNILQDSLEQGDDRVRNEVVKALGTFFTPQTRETLQKVAAEDPNPEIVAQALRALGKYPMADIKETLLTSLQRPSYRHRIAVAAIAAMRTQADPEYSPVLRTSLQQNTAPFKTRDLGAALDTLAYLCREADESEKETTRAFITTFLDTPKTPLLPRVISALGTLGHRKSLAHLEPIAFSGNPDDPAVQAAGEAIKKINEGKKQAEEVKDLREKVSELEREMRGISEKIKKGP